MMRSGERIWLSGSCADGIAGKSAADAELKGAPAPAVMFCLTKA